jgi:hypothetical protein
MIGQPGSVLDPYDDGFGSLQRLMGGRPTPDFIKQAALLDDAERERLPDHAFALVLVGDDFSLRKFACVDPAHVAVNVMYLLEHAGELSKEAQERAATNLLRACNHFQLTPPLPLLKMAGAQKALIKTDGSTITVSTRKSKPITKEASSVVGDPYVALTKPEPVVQSVVEDLPLHTHHQVKEAAAFFDSFGRDLHPRERHEMCVKIASRAKELCIQVSDTIQKYGSRSYEIDDLLTGPFETRRQLWAELENGEAPDLLARLLEKKASLDPEVMAEAVAELDVLTGIDRFWDDAIPDPWLSVLGCMKIAEEWSWAQAGESLSKSELSKFVNQGQDQIKIAYGNAMAEELKQNPTVVFDSLPMDTKISIARLAKKVTG